MGAQTRPRLRRQGRGHPQGLHRGRHPLRGEDHCHQELQRRVDQVLRRQRQGHHPQRDGQQRGGPRGRLRLLNIASTCKLCHHPSSFIVYVPSLFQSPPPTAQIFISPF